MRRVLAYVEEHLAKDITVANLANVACLSIFHFTRVPVFLAIELHPRVSAGHGHDAGRVPTNVAIAFPGRAHPSHYHDPADR